MVRSEQNKGILGTQESRVTAPFSTLLQNDEKLKLITPRSFFAGLNAENHESNYFCKHDKIQQKWPM